MAVKLYGDELSFVNVLGLVMCLGGICCHVVHKFLTYTDEQHSNEPPISYDDDEDESGPGVSKNGLSPKYNPKFDLTHMARFSSAAGGQHRPLLVNDNREAEDSDHLVVNNRNYVSDDSDQGDHDAQDVLFDILQRRER